MDAPPRCRTWKGPSALPAPLAHLAETPRCVLWRFGPTPNGQGKYPKIPFSPHKQFPDNKPRGTYKGAATDDPATWGTFAQCCDAHADWKTWFDGLGLVLAPGEVGIDLDHCYDDGGDLKPYAAAILATFRGRAYIERSVSGTGIHIIVLGSIPHALKTDDVEIYEGGAGRGRYLTLSGQELDGSAPPAPAQDLIDALAAAYGPNQAQATKRAPRDSLLVETVALTPELASERTQATARLGDLLAELPTNMTPQLADLLTRGVFPPAMRDTSASGARAVVVAQLHRAPRRRYRDAEIYVLARELWHRKNWEGAMAGHESSLERDAWRLIALYRPGAPPKPETRTYQDAPDPLVYLAQLADEAVGDVVLLTRDERAALAHCARATAQRTEARLVERGLATLGTYALTGPGTKGRRGMLCITPAGRQALARNESVIFSDFRPQSANESVTPSAPARAKPSHRPHKNTLVGDGASPSAAPPASPPPPPPVFLPPDTITVHRCGPWFYATDGERCGPTARSESAARAFFLPPDDGFPEADDAGDAGIDWADIERRVAAMTPEQVQAAYDQERRTPDRLWSRGEALAWHADERHAPRVADDAARQQTRKDREAARDQARWAALARGGQYTKLRGELQMLRNTVKKRPKDHIWADRRIRELNALLGQLEEGSTV